MNIGWRGHKPTQVVYRLDVSYLHWSAYKSVMSYYEKEGDCISYCCLLEEVCNHFSNQIFRPTNNILYRDNEE